MHGTRLQALLGHWAEKLYRLRIVDTWRYLILLVLLAIVFYLILRINKHKGKIAVTQLAIIPLLSAAWLQVLYYNLSGYACIQGMVLGRPVGVDRADHQPRIGNTI